jgi:hypothetical protein
VFIVSALLTYFVPFQTTILPLLVIFGLNQFSHGAYVAGTNTFLFDVWGRGAGPALQANQVMIGLGGIISPLMASYFVSEQTILGSDVTRDLASNLVWPFTILAAFQGVCAVFSFAFFCMTPSISFHPSRDPASRKEDDNQCIEQEVDRKSGGGCGEDSLDKNIEVQKEIRSALHSTAWKAIMLILVMVMMHMVMGILTSFSKFLTTFTVKSDLHMSPAQGARVTSLFFLMSTITRVVSIFTVQKVGQQQWITCSIIILVLAIGILFPFGDHDAVLLHVAVAMFGVGNACILGCMYGFLNNYIPITPKATLCVFVPAFLGEFTFPLVLSHLIDQDAGVFLWVVLSCTLTAAILFTLISMICRFKLTRNQ